MDIKKLGRIPTGGGWRKLGRGNDATKGHSGVGYAYLHHVVDDCSRLAYSEILADEKKETVVAFWGRAKRFAQQGDCGAYFRVITAGRIRPLDEIRFGAAPEHGVTMGGGEAFAAKLGDKEAARKVFDAEVLPGHHHEQLG